VSSAARAEGNPATLVIGMGNPILRDDAVGVRVVTSLHEALGDIPGVAYMDECSVGGLNLLEVVTGFDRLIVVDSIRAGGPVGGWYHFTARSLRQTLNLSNVHDVNFATALALGRCLGIDLADDESIHVFAIEIEDGRTFDGRMSPALEDAFPDLLREILDHVTEILEIPRRAPGRVRPGQAPATSR
jgi:hydrogenase maturation protease